MYEQFKCGEQNMQVGELKMRFMSTALIHIVWYIRNFFEYLEFCKIVFNLKYDLHSCSFLFQMLSTPKFRSTYSSQVGRRQV
jgi:hypothetical protein